MVRRLLASSVAVLMLAASVSGTVLAGPRTEAGFFEGSLVHFLQPAVFGSDSNQATLGCFGLGPDLAATNRSAPAPILYVILNDYATQDHCDGDPTAARHDHVLSTAPGIPVTRGHGRSSSRCRVRSSIRPICRYTAVGEVGRRCRRPVRVGRNRRTAHCPGHRRDELTVMFRHMPP